MPIRRRIAQASGCHPPRPKVIFEGALRTPVRAAGPAGSAVTGDRRRDGPRTGHAPVRAARSQAYTGCPIRTTFNPSGAHITVSSHTASFHR